MQTKKIILQWPLLLLFFFSYGDLYGESRDCDTDHRHLYLNEGDSLQIAIKAMIAIDAKDIKTQIPTGRLRLFISPKFMEGSFPRIPYRLSNNEIGDSPYCSIFIDISSMRVSTEKEKTTYTYVPSEGGGACGLNIIASSSGSLGGHTDNSCAPGITKILDLDCRQFGGDILTTDKLQTITNPDFLGVKRGCKKARAATLQTRPGSQQKSAADASPEICDPPNILPAPEVSELGDKLFQKAKEGKMRREAIKKRLASGNPKERKEAIQDIRRDRNERYAEQLEWMKNPGQFQMLPLEQEEKEKTKGNPSPNKENCQTPPEFPKAMEEKMNEVQKNQEVQKLQNELQKLSQAEGQETAFRSLSEKLSLLMGKLVNEAEQRMSDDEILAYDQAEEEFYKKSKDYFSRCHSKGSFGKPK